MELTDAILEDMRISGELHLLFKNGSEKDKQVMLRFWQKKFGTDGRKVLERIFGVDPEVFKPDLSG